MENDRIDWHIVMSGGGPRPAIAEDGMIVQDHAPGTPQITQDERDASLKWLTDNGWGPNSPDRRANARKFIAEVRTPNAHPDYAGKNLILAYVDNVQHFDGRQYLMQYCGPDNYWTPNGSRPIRELVFDNMESTMVELLDGTYHSTRAARVGGTVIDLRRPKENQAEPT